MAYKDKIEGFLKGAGSLSGKNAAHKMVDLPDEHGVRYAGFMKRIYASGLDSVFIMLVLMPFYLMIAQDPNYNQTVELMKIQFAETGSLQYVVSNNAAFIRDQLLPTFISNSLRDLIIVTLFVIGLWVYKSSTPGKMIFGMEIVDATTFEKPKGWQWAARYLGYIVSTIPLGLGFTWIAFNKRKRAFHDYLANTVVIYPKSLDPDWQKKNFKRQTIMFTSMLLILAILFWLSSN